MVQFHHHSQRGDVHVIYGVFIQAIIDHISSEFHSENCNQENECPASSDKEDCSLKLSTANHITGNDETLVPIITVIFIHAITQSLDIGKIILAIKHRKQSFYKNILTHLFRIRVLGLRSPPHSSR